MAYPLSNVWRKLERVGSFTPEFVLVFLSFVVSAWNGLKHGKGFYWRGEVVKIAPHIDRFGDIRKMLVDYFQNVALKKDNRLKEDFFKAARKEYGNPLVIKSEDEFHEFTDNFVYSYRLLDNLTVIDRFVSETPNLSEKEKAIVLRWKEPLVGLFQVKRALPDGFVAENLINEVDYTIKPTRIPLSLERSARPGAFFRAKIIPVGNETSDGPFSELIIPLFEAQKLHKVLFLTKSSNVKNLLEIEPHNQAIISFSLNAIPVAKKWEKAPSILKRIEAAKKVYNAGYEVRVRIDPMVPIDNWKESYRELVDLIFENLVPERITLGSLRGLQSTINGCSDKSWVKYLRETSNWGKKIDFQTQFTMYSEVIDYLKSKHNYKKVALCKETIEMWNSLRMNYKQIRCNCIF